MEPKITQAEVRLTGTADAKIPSSEAEGLSHVQVVAPEPGLINAPGSQSPETGTDLKERWIKIIKEKGVEGLPEFIPGVGMTEAGLETSFAVEASYEDSLHYLCEDFLYGMEGGFFEPDMPDYYDYWPLETFPPQEPLPVAPYTEAYEPEQIPGSAYKTPQKEKEKSRKKKPRKKQETSGKTAKLPPRLKKLRQVGEQPVSQYKYHETDFPLLSATAPEPAPLVPPGRRTVPSTLAEVVTPVPVKPDSEVGGSSTITGAAEPRQQAVGTTSGRKLKATIPEDAPKVLLQPEPGPLVETPKKHQAQTRKQQSRAKPPTEAFKFDPDEFPDLPKATPEPAPLVPPARLATISTPSLARPDTKADPDTMSASVTKPGQAGRPPSGLELNQEDFPFISGQESTPVPASAFWVSPGGLPESVKSPHMSITPTKKTGKARQGSKTIKRPKQESLETQIWRIRQLWQGADPSALLESKRLYDAYPENAEIFSIYLQTLHLTTQYKKLCEEVQSWQRQQGLETLPAEVAIKYITGLRNQGKLAEAIELCDTFASQSEPTKDIFWYLAQQEKASCLKMGSKPREAVLLMERTLEDFERSGLENPGILQRLRDNYSWCLCFALTHALPNSEEAVKWKKALAASKTHDYKDTESWRSCDSLVQLEHELSSYPPDLPKLTTLLEHARRDIAQTQFKNPNQRALMHCKLLLGNLKVYSLEGKLSEAIALGSREVPKQISQFIKLKQQHSVLTSSFVNVMSSCVNRHCNDLVMKSGNHPEYLNQAYQCMTSLLECLEQYSPDYILASNVRSTFANLYIYAHEPDKAKELLSKAPPGDIRSHQSKVTIDLEIQYHTGCIFAYVEEDIQQLKHDYPNDMTVTKLACRLLFCKTVLAFINEQDNARALLREAIATVEHLLTTTEHHGFYTWRGHLATLENRPDYANWCHQKSRELSPHKAAIDVKGRISDNWYDRKLMAALTSLRSTTASHSRQPW